MTDVDSIALEAHGSKAFISGKQTKNKAKYKDRSVSYFQFGSQRVINKFQSGSFSTCKSELYMMVNVRQFLNWSRCEERHQVTDVKERPRTRIGQSRRFRYSFLDHVKQELVKDSLVYFENKRILL